MSMTREEIIQEYEGAVVANGLAAAAGNEEAMRYYELFKAGLGALRGPTREQVERMRGRNVIIQQDVGKAVFLTRAEAEAALKERKVET